METKWTETGGLHEEQMIFKVFKVCVSSVEVEEVEEVRTREASAEWRVDGAVM